MKLMESTFEVFAATVSCRPIHRGLISAREISWRRLPSIRAKTISLDSGHGARGLFRYDGQVRPSLFEKIHTR